MWMYTNIIYIPYTYNMHHRPMYKSIISQIYYDLNNLHENVNNLIENSIIIQLFIGISFNR